MYMKTQAEHGANTALTHLSTSMCLRMASVGDMAMSSEKNGQMVRSLTDDKVPTPRKYMSWDGCST